MTAQTIAILDFGGQYTQLIARRVRENHVYSRLVRPEIALAELKEFGVVGIILSGGPGSAYHTAAPKCDPRILDAGIPVLGICYGMQLACQELGGQVSATPTREYGRAQLETHSDDRLLAHLPRSTVVWMSHGDSVQSLSSDFEALAATPSCPYAVVKHKRLPFWGLQFHPEVTHTPEGPHIFRNFLYGICGCKGDWQVGNVIRETVERIGDLVGPDEKVICGLSGGDLSAHTTPPTTVGSISRYFGLWAPLAAIIIIGGWMLGQHYGIPLLAKELGMNFWP